MTEPETSAPSTAKPGIATGITFEDTIEAFDAYAAAVGRVAHAWNDLHERLGVLFAIVSGAKREVALAIWYSVKSDRGQRDMLWAAVNATNLERSMRLPRAPNDLKWLLDRANELAEARNNAVHAPCSLYVGGTVSEMGAAFSNGNPLAKNLVGKDLLVEFAWCEAYAETLSRFTRILGMAIVLPDRIEWPEQPKIPSREGFTGESRRSGPAR